MKEIESCCNKVIGRVHLRASEPAVLLQWLFRPSRGVWYEKSEVFESISAEANKSCRVWFVKKVTMLRFESALWFAVAWYRNTENGHGSPKWTDSVKLIWEFLNLLAEIKIIAGYNLCFNISRKVSFHADDMHVLLYRNRRGSIRRVYTGHY